MLAVTDPPNDVCICIAAIDTLLPHAVAVLLQEL
jgi:hypothetical protein